MKTASNYILDTSREYSIYVCESRAIPKASDGLKDGQRKMIWLMRKKSDKIKTVSLAGESISSGLYLHGDKSASDTISLLAAPYCNNIPLLDGIGNFGTRVAPVEGIGAPRYTYCRRNKSTDKLVLQDLDIVPLKENYDGSTMEPVTFLPIIPLILLNGVSGIAVGWSTEILPRSLGDIIDATIAVIDSKKIKRLIPKYDCFGISATDFGEGVWEFTGKVQIINTSEVLITELPPDITLDKFKKKLIAFEEDGKINDWVDRSTDHINIEVKFKRGALRGWSVDKVIDFFKLRTKKSERLVVIDWSNNAIRQYDTAEELVKDFVEWRFEYYIKRYQKLLDDTIYNLNYWLAVKACFDDDLPGRLTKMKDKLALKSEINTITLNIGLDDEQLEKIAGLPSYRWAKNVYVECKEKIKELKALERQYKRLLKNPNDIRQIFRDEVAALKKEKFNVER